MSCITVHWKWNSNVKKNSHEIEKVMSCITVHWNHWNVKK